MSRAALAIAGMALSSAGCIGSLVATQDPLTTWQRIPLRPDPALAAKAITSTACTPGDEKFPIQVVLQDQRTASTAAFLLVGGGMTGSCMTTMSGGAGGSGWSSAPVPELAAALAIDEESTGDVGAGSASLLGGRVGPGVVKVEIGLADGTSFPASVGNGHWLVWWPQSVLADTITATLADGSMSVVAWRSGAWQVE